MVRGLDNQTGRSIADWEHVLQSVRDILSTPVGSRVMRRTYGSDLALLIDAPASNQTISRIIAAIARALDEWEPRIKVTKVRVAVVTSGKFTADLEVTHNGKPGLLEAVI